MILDQDKKVTAKQKAQEIIAQKLHAAFYSDTWEEPEMTPSEVDEIAKQIGKIIPRLEKRLGGYRA